MEIERDENNRCNPAQFICPQSPSVSKRARRTTSETWTHIRRIRTPDNIIRFDKSLPLDPDSLVGKIGNSMKHHAHVCLECWERLSLTKTGNTWQTSRGTVHLQKCKHNHSRLKGVLCKPAIDANIRSIKKSNLIAESMCKIAASNTEDPSNYNNEAASNHTLMQKSIVKYVKPSDPRQRVLCAQARFYAYSDAKVSKATFDDPFFRELMREQYFAGFKVGNGGSITPKTWPQLNAKGLVSYILEEVKINDLVVQLAFELCHEFAEGNVSIYFDNIYLYHCICIHVFLYIMCAP